MIFSKKTQTLGTPTESPTERVTSVPGIVFVRGHCSTEEVAALAAELQPGEYTVNDTPELSPTQAATARVVVLLDLDSAALQRTFSLLRNHRPDDVPVPIVVIGCRLRSLVALGQSLEQLAQEGVLQQTRLLLIDDSDKAAGELRELFQPVQGPNIISMPVSPEIDDSERKSFFAFSPRLRRTIQQIGELAENNVDRIYLLGAPGSGKTSLAYYYFLLRGKGKFTAVNLSSESTGDKTAMKSLICGHVLGAIPGAQTREGALSFAEDGVCFIDESHGMTGSVMQVLMEVLDSGQFLPLGGTVKRKLKCAVVFASNRSWDTLRTLMHIDEHARLGATVVEVPDLAARTEDMIAVSAITLARFAERCTSWTAPEGLTAAAWEQLLECPWRGNVRTLIRVLETAAVEAATSGVDAALLDDETISAGLELWEAEPAEEEKQLYISVR